MLLAETAATAASKFNGFDIFVLLFTLIIAIGVVRLVKAPRKNLFAIGFGAVSLLIFLITDIAMIKNWFS